MIYFNTIIHIDLELIKLLINWISSIVLARIYSIAQEESLRDYMSLQFNTFTKFTHGDLLLRQYEKADTSSNLIYLIIPTLFRSSTSLIQILSEIAINQSLSILSTFILSVILHLLLLILLIKKYNFLQKCYIDSKLILSSVLSNEVDNFDVIKTYGLKETSIKTVMEANKKRRESRMKLKYFMNRNILIYKSIELFILFGIYLLKGFKMIHGNVFTLCDFTIKLHSDLRDVINTFVSCNNFFCSFYLLELDYEEIKPRIIEIKEILEIKAENLKFGKVFKNLNFRIKKNDKVAIIGPCGSGKSLLLNTINGFIDIQNVDRMNIDDIDMNCLGKLTINSININNINRHSLRSQITLISQNEYYSYGTVMKNLQYGNNLTPNQIVKECQKFDLHNFILNFQNGYLKNSTQGGFELSGGQKQRIHIMRGILRNTPVLLIDDCFSNINNSDQRDLIRKILSLKDKTVLMVLRNSEHLDLFDKVILMDNKCCKFDDVTNLSHLLKSKKSYI